MKAKHILWLTVSIASLVFVVLIHCLTMKLYVDTAIREWNAISINDTVTCSSCGAILHRKDAIPGDWKETIEFFKGEDGWYKATFESRKWFCGKCAPTEQKVVDLGSYGSGVTMFFPKHGPECVTVFSRCQQKEDDQDFRLDR